MKLFNSFGYAWKGIQLAFQGQSNMKWHLLAAITISFFGYFLKFDFQDWCIVVIMIGMVMGAEIFNTAIEELVNFVSPEKQTQAGKIKDLAAGAVLVVSLAAFLVGLILIYSKVN